MAATTIDLTPDDILKNEDSDKKFDEIDDDAFAALLTRGNSDEATFDIDVDVEETAEEKAIRRQREDKDKEVADSISNSYFESLREHPKCMELPRGVPLDVFVPGASTDDDLDFDALAEH